MKPFALLAATFMLARGFAFADDAKPLRHLVYDVSTHYSSTSTSASYSGTQQSMVVDGADEKVQIDVMAAANDGGLVIRSSVFDSTHHRQHATHVCAVYADSRVICPPNDQIESELLVLLSFLGRGFYDPSNVTNGEWQTTTRAIDADIVNHFKVVGAPSGDIVRIVAHQATQNDRTIYEQWLSDDDIAYDTKMSVPVRIHDEGHLRASGGETENSQIDYRLTSDSFSRQ